MQEMQFNKTHLQKSYAVSDYVDLAAKNVAMKKLNKKLKLK